MTRVWLVSDLHLEDLDPERRGDAPRVDFDVLACAGDVLQSDPAGCVDAVAALAAGKPALLVLGNHDVWDVPLDKAVAEARARHPGVTVLEAGTARIGGLVFAGGTLWDDPDDWPAGIPRLGLPAEAPIGEPLLVEDGDAIPRRATARDLAVRHALTMDAIASASPHLVLTHYPPSQAGLDRLPRPVTWLHGHLHDPLAERRGGHLLARMPWNRQHGLAGLVLTVGPDGRVIEVQPVKRGLA